MRTLQGKQLQLVLLRSFSILVGVSALVCGVAALRRDANAFEGPPRSAFHPLFLTQLRLVRQRLPPGAPVLHLSASPEFWYSRLWQRVLYPDHETIAIEPPLNRELVRRLRSKYGVRFAISAGEPPFDPGFLWKIELGPLALGPGQSWFGELAP